MIATSEVEVGDYFRLDDNTIIRIIKKLGTDYYECSDDDIHSIDELLPLESVYLDSGSNPDLYNELLLAGAGPINEDGMQTLFQEPAHIVQNRMREQYGVEYELDKEFLKGSDYKLILYTDIII